MKRYAICPYTKYIPWVDRQAQDWLFRELAIPAKNFEQWYKHSGAKGHRSRGPQYQHEVENVRYKMTCQWCELQLKLL